MSRIACRGDGRALFVQRGRSDIHEQVEMLILQWSVFSLGVISDKWTSQNTKQYYRITE